MKRTLSIAVLMLMTASGFAADRFNQDPQQMPIATTGRILRIDAKTRTLKIRASEGQSLHILPEIKESLWQRIGGRVPSVRMPSIAVLLPGHAARNTSVRPAQDGLLPNEYTVITAHDTLFQDGSDNLRLEDFHSGETISIHGVFHGSTLKASRIAKWE
jgi:hypothetical protein